MPIVPSSVAFRRSLVLAGGGVRLAYHAGVLVALEEAGLSFDHVDGTSGGIFGTAMLASGIAPKDAAVRWRKLNLDGFMTAMPVKLYSNLDNLPAFGSADGIRKTVFPSLGIDVQKINANTSFKATFNVCNFSHKTIESITNKDVTEDYLIAGMSLPMFLPAVKINDDWYTDAVWIKDANMTGAVTLGAEEIWLVWCIGNTWNFLDGTFNQYVHMIEISANGGLFTEMAWLQSFNADRIQKGLKPIDIHIIKPEYALPLDPDFLLHKINADTLIDMGYADTKQYLANPRAFDYSNPIFTASAMTTVSATLHFRQQFFGRVMMDGRSCPVTIQLSFFIREVNGQYAFQSFSSISINEGDFISGYANTIDVGKNGKLNVGFTFILGSVEYPASIKMQLHSMIDWRLGIDNKTALVNIGTGKGQETDTLFVQPALNRIRNAWYLNVNTQGGWFRKQKVKRKLLSNLF